MSHLLTAASLSVMLTAGLLAQGLGVQPSSYLGVGVITVDEEVARKLGMDEARGVEIAKIMPNSPAAQAGLREGDVVVGFQGRAVDGVQQFAQLVNETPVGSSVKMDVVSASGKRQATVLIGARAGTVFSPKSRTASMERRVSIDIPRTVMVTRNLSLGATLEQIEGQFAQSFGVPQGVLVRSVDPETPAAKAGLKAGDVITKVGGEGVLNPIDVRRRLAQATSDDVQFELVRNGDPRTLTVAGGRGSGAQDRLRTRSVAR